MTSLLNKEGPICPLCNYRAIDMTVYNGEKMCIPCKKKIQKGLTIKKFNRGE